MPTYGYVCNQWSSDFETFASIQKKESGWEPKCPKCRSARTQQIFKPVMRIGNSRRARSGGNACCFRRGG